MPATGNRDLYLQVGGDVSNLKAAMKDGRSSLLDLVAAAQDAQDETNQALRNIAADPAALKQLVGAYDQTFAAIRRNAQAAMSANDNTSALKIIDAAGAEQQAAAVAVQAAQLRIAADAAAAVAERQGEAGVAARVLAAALEVQAVEASKVASAMRGQADVLAEVAQEAKLAGAREDELTGGHQRMGSSGMIAEHVIRSLSDSIAAGQSPIRAVTMEMGRITEAMTMFAQTTGETKGVVGALAGFMGGPWGLAMSVGVAVLTPLIAELFEMHDAAKLAELGNDGLADAQSILGKMFDLTSGKLDKQNSLLRLNAELTAVNLRAKATDEKSKSDATVASLGKSSWSNFFEMEHFGDDVGAAPRQLMNMVRTKQIDPAEAARRAQTVDMTGSKVSRQEFMEALAQSTRAQYDNNGADDIETALRTGKLPDELKNTPKEKKPRKPKVDHTAEREANKDRAYQSELNTAQDRLAKAQLSLADTAEGRFKLEVDELNASKVQRDLEIDDQVKAKKISQAEADKLKALNAEATELEKQAAQRKEVSALLQQQLTSDEHARAARDAVLQIDADMATTRAERLQKEQQLLTDSQAGRRDKLNNVLQDPNRSDADKQLARQDLAALPAQEAAERRQQAKQNEDPLEAYGDQLKSKVGDMNDALKGVAADGMKGVEDGLVGLISGTESAAQAFKKMAASIISDLARIAIEKAFVAVLGFKDGNVPGFATGHIPGFASGIIRGPGTGTSDSILGYMQGVGSIFVSNGESIMTAEATRRYGPSLKAMNDNTFPSFATGLVPDSALGYPALPSARSIARPAPPPQVIYLQVDKSELFNTHVARIAAPLAQAAMVGGAQQAQQDFADQRMASIP